jgi:hypothetical protein
VRAFGGTGRFVLVLSLSLLAVPAVRAADPPTTTTKPGTTGGGGSKPTTGGSPTLVNKPASGGRFQIIEAAGSGEVAMRAICGIDGFSSCAKVMPSVKSAVFGQVKQHVDAAYQGKLIDLSRPGQKGASNFIATEFIRTPICNPMDQVYGNEAGKLTNHLGEKCGDLCRIKCTQPPGGSVSCSMENPRASCGRERAFTRGTLIQTIWHKYDVVVAEFSDPARGNKLKLSPPCQALVRDQQTAQVFRDASEEIQRYQLINQGREISCPALGDSPTPQASGDPQGEQAACYLSSSRTMLEGLIATVATCEIFARAGKDFKLEELALQGLPKDLMQSGIRSCDGQQGSAAQFEKCVNDFYVANVDARFAQQMRSLKDAPIERPAAANSSGK